MSQAAASFPASPRPAASFPASSSAGASGAGGPIPTGRAPSWPFGPSAGSGAAIAALLILTSLSACRPDVGERPERETLRVLITVGYRAALEGLMNSGASDLTALQNDIEWVEIPSYEGRDAVFAPSLAARFPESDPDADVFFMDLYRIGAFRPGWLTRFDKLGARGSAFRPAFLRAARLEGEDNPPFAIPWSAKGNFLFYRKDLVQEVPQTFKEVFDACEAIDVRRLPRGVRYCLLINWRSVQNDLYPALWSLNPDGPVDLVSDGIPEFLAGLSARVGSDIRAGFLAIPSARDLPRNKSLRAVYGEGQAVFMINWNNRYRLMRRALGDRVPQTGIAPIPAAKPGGPHFSNIGTWGFVVPPPRVGASETAKRRHQKAMRFVAAVSSPEATRFLVKSQGILPARTDVALPAELDGVLDAGIADALSGKGHAVIFRDRGSDALVHRHVGDALTEVLTCHASTTRPSTLNLPRCAQYVDECYEQRGFDTDCFLVAIRRVLSEADRSIQEVAR